MFERCDNDIYIYIQKDRTINSLWWTNYIKVWTFTLQLDIKSTETVKRVIAQFSVVKQVDFVLFQNFNHRSVEKDKFF